MLMHAVCFTYDVTVILIAARVDANPGGTWMRAGGEVKGKGRMECLATSLAPCTEIWTIQHYYQQQKHTTSWLANSQLQNSHIVVYSFL